MKRFLITLILFGLCCPVMAQQATVNRLSKDVSDLCVTIIDTKHTMVDVFVCLSDAFSNPYVWRSGWSKKITTNLIAPLAQQGTFTEALTTYEEDQMAPLLRQQMILQFQQYINILRQSPNYKTNLTVEQVKKFK